MTLISPDGWEEHWVLGATIVLNMLWVLLYFKQSEFFYKTLRTLDEDERRITRINPQPPPSPQEVISRLMRPSGTGGIDCPYQSGVTPSGVGTKWL